MIPYDKNDPLTFCSWCMKEAGIFPKPGQTTGICGKHAEAVLRQARAEEAAAWEKARKRFATSPEVQRALSDLRSAAAQERANLKRKQAAFALQVAGGCLAALLGLAGLYGLLRLLGR